MRGGRSVMEIDVAFCDQLMIETDFAVSRANLDDLKRLIGESRRSVVFFVGAGASAAGKTSMPVTADLLDNLFHQAVAHSSSVNSDTAHDVAVAIKTASSSLGFEITLNDLWQISQMAVHEFFFDFAAQESCIIPNSVHRFLAHWLETGGIVLTTNYDRLIERSLSPGADVNIRYTEAPGDHSFDRWPEDLLRGGCLFKLHGSLDDLQSCLGALEHVRTELHGNRAAVLEEIVKCRPLCFVGWRGVDPDIPKLLSRLAGARPTHLSTSWLHRGRADIAVSLNQKIAAVPRDVRPLAAQKPILADAERLFEFLCSSFEINKIDTSGRKHNRLPLKPTITSWSSSGAMRFAGIGLRRNGSFSEARRVLEAAKLADDATQSEIFAAMSEIALTYWAENDEGDQRRAFEILERIERMNETCDQLERVTLSFGLMSMWFSIMGSNKDDLLRASDHLNLYALRIELLRNSTSDSRQVALHEALLDTYRGKYRNRLFGDMARRSKVITDWILEPFERAQARIQHAGDIHPHSTITVLLGCCLALAQCGRCADAWALEGEIDRLCDIVSDTPLRQYWVRRQERLRQLCPTH
jgi:hypothetical protein